MLGDEMIKSIPIGEGEPSSAMSALLGEESRPKNAMDGENGDAQHLSSQEIMHLEHTHGAHNYHPLPVVFSKAQGIYVWDPEGRKYMDFLSAYSAVNQGHAHPRLVQTMVEQASKLTLSSRAFYNDIFGQFARHITQYFGYDMVLPMNTGAEGVETALKLARKWGYLKKGIPANKAIILACTNNFHGRTLGVISMSTDPDATTGFGPYLPNVASVCPAAPSHTPLRYNNLADLELALTTHGPHVAAFLVEPIQGEAGIVVPDKGYLSACAALCRKHNVLFIADEIQTGLCRTGRMLAIDHEGIKADILILGKALSGGMYPVSAVLSSKEVMLCIQPGEHGSTYGGNPLGCAVAMTALDILKEERLAERADVLGEKFRAGLRALNSSLITQVRGQGLLNAIVINDTLLASMTTSSSSATPLKAWHLCLLMKHYGLLAKPTHKNIIRLAPPLCITEEEIERGVVIVGRVLKDVESGRMKRVEDVPGHDL